MAKRPTAKLKTKQKAIKKVVKKRRVKAANSAKIRIKKKPRGKAFEKGNEHRFLPGQSGNPDGRPKLLTGAYTAMLAEVDPETGMTKAEMIASAGYARSMSLLPGGTAAAREIRQATEGDTIHSTIDFDEVAWKRKLAKRRADVEEMDDE